MHTVVKKIFSKLRISRLKWYDLRTVHPVSSSFGFDRGKPIDRYYIENFLEFRRNDINGKVLEVAESRYAKRFGNGVSSYEILHVEPTKNATMIGDLSQPNTLPENVVNCFICTQVFNFIYDYQKAIEGAFKVLQPGGILLATVSGISQISSYDAKRWGHYWSFYPQGIGRAVKDVFGDKNVAVESFGNSLAAIAFLKGISSNELTVDELNYADENYPVTICIVAKKPN